MSIPFAEKTIDLDSRVARFLEKGPKELFIGGEFVPSVSGKTFETVNPSTGEVITSVFEADKEDVDKAVDVAEKVFYNEWSKVPSNERGKLLWRLADLIEEHLEPLAQLESLDNGKPITHARTIDLPLVIDHFRYYAGWATKVHGEVIENSSGPEMLTYTRREPIGVVGQIIPWNFPMLMLSWKMGAALATGNVLVFKTAEQTPLTALYLADLINEAGFPPGVVNILSGFGETAGEAIVKHPRIRKIAFTGSTAVGKHIQRQAADNLKRLSLELGGKSPNIIFSDADLTKAIPGSMVAIFFNMGQACTAGSRLFIHKKIYDNVLADMSAAAKDMQVGMGLNETTDIGPLVSDEQFKRVNRFLEEGHAAGAETLIGGQPIDRSGYYIPPTIFADVDREMSISREEIFGPVLAATPFEDEDDLTDIIRRANDTEYGLAAGVWTTDLSKAHRVAHKIEAGTIWVNDYNALDAAVPFGGYKQSGYGREMGAQALDLYTQVKSVWVNLT